MSTSDNQYSKLRWVLTVCGLLLYVADVWTDVKLAVRYFGEQHYVWCGLTLLFVLAGLAVTQIFSLAWYLDDMNDRAVKPEETADISGMSRRRVVVLHACGLGVFTRFYHLLKEGFHGVWKRDRAAAEEPREVHRGLFCMATDLSMLKLFEAFLESAPQLLLQLHILLGHGEGLPLQYVSVTFACFNLAWALVDYRRCLRRSLPLVRNMPSGLPTAVYLLYKLCTMASLILSYSLLLVLSPYSTVAFTLLWLLATTWTHTLRTAFCSCRSLELLYRAVVGVVLTFTFFNVKGQDTKVAMGVYYALHCLVHLTALLLTSLLKPQVWTNATFLTVRGLIIGGSAVGLACLLFYYLFLHPGAKDPAGDEVDGLGSETESARRQRNAMQP